jgi:ABC-type polysaccharide/polyol phosphate transport system ATPase subunit
VAVTTAPDRRAERAARIAAAPAAVVVDDVTKCFRIPKQAYSTFKERVLHPRRSSEYDTLRAVDGVSFSVAQGEFFGIVGRNGSGKSTLLKLLAGIYEPDGGEIEIEGRLSPFIELGVGFNPDLAARDNVAISAVMLGLSRRDARERFDDIIAFAELEDFTELRLKNYSSGMQVRLAFSTAIQVDADVLLVDEVLAVGDAAFQQKCFEQFQAMKEAGRTIVFVTHDMGAVQRFCDRAMLVEKGRILAIDEPDVIARAYNEINFGRLQRPDGDDSGRHGAHAEAEITRCWFEDAGGARIAATAQGQPFAVGIEITVHEPLTDPIFAVTLRNSARHTIFATSSSVQQVDTGHFEPGVYEVRIRMENHLAPSTYTATPSIARAGTGDEAIDMREDLATLVLHGTRFSGGVVDSPHEFVIVRK